MLLVLRESAALTDRCLAGQPYVPLVFLDPVQHVRRVTVTEKSLVLSVHLPAGEGLLASSLAFVLSLGVGSCRRKDCGLETEDS